MSLLKWQQIFLIWNAYRGIKTFEHDSQGKHRFFNVVKWSQKGRFRFQIDIVIETMVT